MWQGLQETIANIYRVYSEAVWRESEDMAQWSSVSQVKGISFGFITARADMLPW